MEAIIRGIELDDKTNNVKYKIWFESDNFHKKQGCTGCSGYINQDDIIEKTGMYEIGYNGGIIVGKTEILNDLMKVILELEAFSEMISCHTLIQLLQLKKDNIEK